MIDREKYQDCLRLSDAARRELLRTLESRTSVSTESRRKQPRHIYAGHNISLELHDSGRALRYLTCSRNLSATGLSVLHGGFVYPGTRCAVTLTTLEGENEMLDGMVCRCNYVKGTIHEIGIQFDRPIDPMTFVPCDERTLSQKQIESLAGMDARVLFLDDSEAELLLFKHHMRVTGFDVMTARNAREAGERIGAEAIDLFICDLDLGAAHRSGEEVIQLARGAGFGKPILALTGTTDIERLRLAKTSGASKVLLKPYSPTKLLETLAELLNPAPSLAPTAGETAEAD